MPGAREERGRMKVQNGWITLLWTKRGAEWRFKTAHCCGQTNSGALLHHWVECRKVRTIRRIKNAVELNKEGREW
eukprot:1160442-Pelagomonas_calceolata.AAC.7